MQSSQPYMYPIGNKFSYLKVKQKNSKNVVFMILVSRASENISKIASINN